MYIFSQKQIQELMLIVDQHQMMFVGTNVGMDYLTDQEVDVLRRAGLPVGDMMSRKGYVDEAFTFGILASGMSDQRAKGMNYTDFKKFMSSKNYMPLTDKETAAIDHLKYETFSDISWLGEKVKRDVKSIIVEKDKEYRSKYEDIILDSAIKTVEMRGSVRDMVSEIGHKTGDWERDLGRIAEYTLHNAYEEGRAAQLERSSGKEVLVYKDVYPGACKHCVKHYLTAGPGSKPRVFKLNDLRANGNNVGKKAADWVPTLGPMHPYCRCTLNELPEGHVWSEEEVKFVRGKRDLKEKVRNRKKVSVKIGNQDYMV